MEKMTPSQAELLLRLAENRQAEGEDLIVEMRRMGSTHAQSLLDDEQMLIKALEINRQGQERFANYMPRPAQQPAGIGRNIAAALIHGGKDEVQAKDQRPAGGQRS
jgi:hypothetical protein